jgi:LAO/AO transport system kinase
MPLTMSEQAQAILEGNRRALARLLTQIENESETIDETLATLYSHTGGAQIIGITGAPGTGKSSLVNALAKAYRGQSKTVAIIAVDPTSPFSGGAILGDRIRMQSLTGDPGVFIRSMATRGNLGGLSRATREVIRVLDAAGFDVILVETVGAGQSEVDIALLAHTTVVVEAPGLGDDVQAIKAGILEIADILVVNKADLPGAQKTRQALRAMIDLGHPVSRTQLMNRYGRRLFAVTESASNMLWIPLLVETVATTGMGIDDLIDAIDQHREALEIYGLKAVIERQQIQNELLDKLTNILVNRILDEIPIDKFNQLIDRVQAREIDPHGAINIILDMGS